MSTGVTGAQREDAAGRNAFSAVLIALMKGVLHAEVAPKDWQALLDLQARVRDHVAPLGLDLMLVRGRGLRLLAPASGG